MGICRLYMKSGDSTGFLSCQKFQDNGIWYFCVQSTSFRTQDISVVTCFIYSFIYCHRPKPPYLPPVAAVAVIAVVLDSVLAKQPEHEARPTRMFATDSSPPNQGE